MITESWSASCATSKRARSRIGRTLRLIAFGGWIAWVSPYATTAAAQAGAARQRSVDSPAAVSPVEVNPVEASPVEVSTVEVSTAVSTVRAGKPMSRLRVRLGAEAEALTVRIQGRPPIRLRTVRGDEATVEAVRVAADEALLLLRTRREAPYVAVLRVGPRRVTTLFEGSTAFRGDRGERTRNRVTTEDRNGDGFADLVVARQHEAVRLCGRPPALLTPRAYDPARGALRPVQLSRIGAGLEAEPVTASRRAPAGLNGPPVLRRALRFVAASAGGLGDYGPPSALGDGDPATAWSPGSDGRGEFVVARFTGGVPIRALAIRDSGALPRSLWLVGDARALRVDIPPPAPADEAAKRDADRVFITPPAPLAWSCFSVVIGDGAAGSPARRAVHTRIMLGDIEVYTELDGEGGIERLVSRLDGERGEGAEHSLGGLEAAYQAEGVAALRGAWATLGPRGRRRGMRAMSALARRGSRAALGWLAEQSRSPSWGQRAIQALGALPARRASGAGLSSTAISAPADAVADALASRAEAPLPWEEALTAALARHPSTRATVAVLARLDTEDGAGDPRIRQALSAMVGRKRLGAELLEWLRGEGPVAGRAAALLALAATSASASSASNASEIVAQNAAALSEGLVSLAARARGFVDLYRLVKASARLPANAPTDAWLANLAQTEARWMLREAALRALFARGSARADAVAATLLRDRYPRVRVAALEVLRGKGAARQARAGRLRDRWPMVRAAALVGLRDEAAVRQAIQDSASAVRRAALREVRRTRDREAGPAIDRLLKRGDRSRLVLEEAIRYVEQQCDPRRAAGLVALVERGTLPGASANDRELGGLAMRAAARVGGSVLEQARSAARGHRPLLAIAARATPGCSGAPGER